MSPGAEFGSVICLQVMLVSIAAIFYFFSSAVSLETKFVNTK